MIRPGDILGLVTIAAAAFFLLSLGGCGATEDGKPTITVAEAETRLAGYTDDGRQVIEHRPAQEIVIHEAGFEAGAETSGKGWAKFTFKFGG